MKNLHIKNNVAKQNNQINPTRITTTGAAQNHFCWMHTKNQRK